MISSLGGSSYWKQDTLINEGFPILKNNLQDRGIYDTTQTGSYYFNVSNDTLRPNNIGVNSQVAHNYLKIDLTNVDSSASYKIIVNASISSELNHDYGYATINNSTAAPGYNIETGQFMKISGQQSGEYTTNITGGSTYYLHLCYRKDSSNSGFNSTASNENFTINSITIVTDEQTVDGVKIPEGYTPTGKEDEDEVDEGLVITDTSGNEYVWIEVPKTATVYPTAGLNITSFTDTDYEKIEKDLSSYSDYYNQNGTDKDAADEWYGYENYKIVTYNQSGLTNDQKLLTTGCGLNYNDYYKLKKKMLKSVYQNGGFWIGRYEAGKTIKEQTTTASALSQQNKYPYQDVTCSEAQTLASKMPTSGGLTSSLMFGVQWNLVCKFLENNASSLGSTISERQSAINKNSNSWGNYYYTSFTLNRGEFSTDDGRTWSSYTSNTTKGSGKAILLTTGASDKNKILNIYDFAGNAYEWTLEASFKNTSMPCCSRGGDYTGQGDKYPASFRTPLNPTSYGYGLSFRVALY